MNAVFSIEINGMTSINCCEDINSSSGGVIDTRRTSGRAMGSDVAIYLTRRRELGRCLSQLGSGL